LENQIFALESQIESEKSGRNQIPQSEISNITTELELLKEFFRHTTGRKQRTQQQTDNARMRISAITPEYLRSLYKR